MAPAADDVWKTADKSEEVTQLLKSEYTKAGDLLKFSQWFACQGFLVNLGSALSLGLGSNSAVTTIAALLLTKNHPFPLNLVYFIFSRQRGTQFIIELDQFGQIKEVKHGYKLE